jgi:hypothetical protein
MVDLKKHAVIVYSLRLLSAYYPFINCILQFWASRQLIFNGIYYSGYTLQ